VSSELYDLNCPSCGKHYTLPLDKVVKNAGKRIHCRRCHQLFVIPIPTAVPIKDAVTQSPDLALVPEAPTSEEAAIAAPGVEPPTPMVETEAPSEAQTEVGEPPSLSEYGESTIADPPAEAHAPADSETATTTTDHDSIHGVAMADAPARDEGEAVQEVPSELPTALDIEAPPPPLPPIPVSTPALPKPRRGGRASVAPVFDPTEEEEPQPRRRGRFGMRSEPRAPIDAAVSPALEHDEPVADLPPGESMEITPPVIEASHPEPAVEKESTDDGNTLELSADVVADTTPALPISEDPSLQVIAPAPSTAKADSAISTPVSEDLSAIRRSVALLATMSVIISVVLIAVLLALLGIIPKK